MADSRSTVLLTRSQVAKVLGVHVSRVRQLEGNALHPIKDERGVHLFARAEVDELARRRGVARAEKDGELVARVFEMFREGRSLVEIVIETKLDPETVQKLYAQFRTPLGGTEANEERRRKELEDEEMLREWERRREARRGS